MDWIGGLDRWTGLLDWIAGSNQTASKGDDACVALKLPLKLKCSTVIINSSL